MPPVALTGTSDWDNQDLQSAIPLSQFASHVARLHADSDIGFSKEYEAIQEVANQNNLTVQCSQHSENKLKNRYLNILACEYFSSTVDVCFL